MFNRVHPKKSFDCPYYFRSPPPPPTPSRLETRAIHKISRKCNGKQNQISAVLNSLFNHPPDLLRPKMVVRLLRIIRKCKLFTTKTLLKKQVQGKESQNTVLFTFFKWILFSFTSFFVLLLSFFYSV